jgi:hypothetical protein
LADQRSFCFIKEFILDVVKLLSLSNYLCVNISIAKALNPNAAILLSLLCKQYEYWRNRNELNNGYFYVTREKIYDKSGLQRIFKEVQKNYY